MRVIKIRDVIEIIGIFSIVASLIFVGIQLRLEQTIALGASYQERAESRKEDLRFRMELELSSQDTENQVSRGNYPRWWTAGIASVHNDQGVPVGEIVRIYERRNIDLVHLDNMIFQQSLGLISDDIVDMILGVWQERGVGEPISIAVVNYGLVRKETKLRLEELGYQLDN